MRIDNQRLAGHLDLVFLTQAQQVPVGEEKRADFVKAALVGMQPVVKLPAGFGTQRGHALEEVGRDHPDRQALVQAQPDQREQAPVL